MAESLLVQLERDNPPHAEVTKVGRWTWRIVIKDGIGEYGPGMSGVVCGWHVMGRNRAARRAARELRRYLAQECPERFEVWTWGDLTGRGQPAQLVEDGDKQR